MATGPDGTRLQHHRPYRRFSVGIAIASLVVAASWSLVTRLPTTSVEERLFRIINGAPDALWPPVWLAMQLGNIVVPVVVAAAAAVALRRVRLPVAALLAGYGAWGVAQVVKAAVVRDRPDALLSDVILREGAHGLGFVSGHAAIVTALATVVWPYLTLRGRAAVAVGVTIVGFGRVYAGAHLPLDVVGGAAIGALAGLAVNALVGLPLPGSPRAGPPELEAQPPALGTAGRGD